MHDTLKEVDDLILSFIKVGEDKVNLQIFTDIVDQFFYIPIKLEKNISNDSKNMFFVMTSNTLGNHSYNHKD